MKNMRILLGLLIPLLLCTHCIETGTPFSGIPPGIWRSVVYLGEGSVKSQSQGTFDEKSKAELPFNFEVIYDTPDSFHLELIHGKERIIVDDIRFGLDRSIGKDTIEIHFPVYDSYLKGKYEEDAIEGIWIVNNREDYRIPFKAVHSKDWRFTNDKDVPKMDLTGKWSVILSTESDNPDPAIGIFEQDENELTGTFLTETGDYRFLEGTVQDDRMFLSTFDGAHAFLFEAKILDDGTLSGIFRSGSHYKTYWSAERNDNATLKDPYELTYLNEGFDRVEFSFPTPDGEMVSLSDERFKGKAKLVQIFGTWCPNCYDETRFLVDYLKANPRDDLEVVGLAFERHKDLEKAKSSIRRYAEKMNVPYPLLFAGPSDKSLASKALPMINRVISYPTLIFIDRNDKVRKIHTGFNGPATPGYEAFKEEFDQLIEEITSDNTEI